MKVLAVNPTYGGLSGSGRHLKQLVEALRGRVEFHLWTKDTVKMLNLPKLKSLSFYIACKMNELPDVDIVHVHNPKFSGLLVEGIPGIITVHGDTLEFAMKYGPIGELAKKYFERAMRKAKAVTTVSPYTARLRGWKWIPNMVDLDSVKRIEPAELNEGALLFVGRDDPIKDYPLFRRIAERAHKELGLKSLALGVIRDDDEFIRHERVPWERVISYMKSARALVITSRQEGMPSSLLEAWASGCPVVARNIPAIAEIERSYKGSLLLFDGTVESAIEALRSLMDDDLRSSLIENGLRAVSDFDAKSVANKYYELYKEVLSS